VTCDLASFKSIHKFVDEWNKLDLPLHILVNNAGVMAIPRSMTADGYEMQFGINHLGHFLLTNLLLPSLKKANNARVVVVSSKAHFDSDIRFDTCGKMDIYNEFFGDWKAYCISKTANVLFSMELDRRYKEYGIHSNSLHPGNIWTDLGRSSTPVQIYYSISRFFLKTMSQGAATTVYVATAPELEGVGGKYFSDCQISDPASHVTLAAAKKLWTLSEKWVGITEE